MGALQDLRQSPRLFGPLQGFQLRGLYHAGAVWIQPAEHFQCIGQVLRRHPVCSQQGRTQELQAVHAAAVVQVLEQIYGQCTLPSLQLQQLGLPSQPPPRHQEDDVEEATKRAQDVDHLPDSGPVSPLISQRRLNLAVAHRETGEHRPAERVEKGGATGGHQYQDDAEGQQQTSHAQNVN